MNYIDSTTFDEMYNEMLGGEGTIKVAGLEYLPSIILNSVDPIAYACGKSDYADSLTSDDYTMEGYE